MWRRRKRTMMNSSPWCCSLRVCVQSTPSIPFLLVRSSYHLPHFLTLNRRAGFRHYKRNCGVVSFPSRSRRKAVEASSAWTGDVLSETAEDGRRLSAEEEDRQNVQQILAILDQLQTKRDMSFNEVRLTVIIEDPREAERRQKLGFEDERVCSREEMGTALVDVYEGRIPSDRLVLQELVKELLSWPELENDVGQQTNPFQSPYARVTDTGIDPRVSAQRAKIDWDAAAEIQPGDQTKYIGEKLPTVVGFSVLYLVTAIPIFIGVSVAFILFFNSLK
eukprot:c27369_g1_i1 orf=973-1803(-)